MFGFGLASFGQDLTNNPAIQEQIFSVFEELDLSSSQVNTGYLLDRAVDFIDLKAFDGQTLNASNVADFETLICGFHTMNTARVNSRGQQFSISNIVNSYVDTTAIEFGAAIFKYNYIVNNALTDNLLTFQGGKLYNVVQGTNLLNPYDSTRAFIFAASVPTHSGQAVRLKLSSNHFYTSHSYPSEQPTLYELSINNLPYQQISLPYDSLANLSLGSNSIKLRVTLIGGTTLEGQTSINISDNNTNNLPALLTAMPDNTWQIDTTSSYGDSVGAIVSYKCTATHGAGIIKKPLIFVEGFDDSELGLASSLFSKGIDLIHIFHVLSGISIGCFDFEWFYNGAGFGPEIKDEFDMFYVDWTNPRADIRSNAELLEKIINRINKQKHNNGSFETNVVIGHSMGGLIARYALCDMEERHALHETSCYVSYDAPQLGVNVPLGAQYAVRDLFDHIGNVADLGPLYHNLSSTINNVLDCNSAKQMMYYYVSQDQSITANTHNGWQAILNEKGYPKGDYGRSIDNLSIVNGGDSSTIPEPILLRLVTSLFNVHFDIQINRNDGTGQAVYRSLVKTYKFNWGFSPSEVILWNTEQYAPVDNLNLDYGPSSTLIDSFSSSILGLTYNGPISFVPVRSALNTYMDGFGYTNPPRPIKDTPFNAYYLNQREKRHERTDSSYWSWVYNQTRFALGGPDDFALTGDVFSVTGIVPSEGTAVFSVSDPTKAAISSDGELSVAAPSIQTIDYCRSNNGKYYRKQKTVLAGFPTVALWKSYGNPGEVTVHASCNDSCLKPILDTLLSRGILSCKWLLLKTTAQIEEYNTQSLDMFIDNSQSEYVSVSFQLYDAVRFAQDTTRISPTYSIPLYANNVVFNRDPISVSVSPFSTNLLYQTVSDYIHGVPEDDPIFYYCPYELNNYFVLWKSSAYSNWPDPDSIKIANQVIPLEETIQETINGQPTTLFCFKLLDSYVVQSEIQRIRQQWNNSPLGVILQIKICRNQMEMQTVLLPVVPE